MKSRNIAYMPGVDHLRAFAALLVLFYHGGIIFTEALQGRATNLLTEWVVAANPWEALIAEGHTAVALFMVLSGFIFTFGAYGKNIEYRPFIRNRFLRTYPLFLFFLFVGMAAFPERVTLQGVVMTIGGLANVHGTLELAPFSSMFWTIAVEWQFYLVFPFIFGARGEGLRSRVLGLLALMLLVRIVVSAETNTTRDPAYWTIIGRLDQFLLGMIAAVAARTMQPKHPGRWLLAAAALPVAAVWWLNSRGGWPVTADPVRLIWPTIEGACWAAFVVSYVRFAARIPQRLSRVLCHLGSISYSLYLWQWVIVHTLSKRDLVWRFGGTIRGDALINTALIALPLTLIAATLTYNLVEKPFLDLRSPYLKP